MGIRHIENGDGFGRQEANVKRLDIENGGDLRRKHGSRHWEDVQHNSRLGHEKECADERRSECTR
jgi:hypothetical protein